MVSLSCSTTASDDVTLVTAVVRGEGERRRVRLANRLDGPIWPPRCQGVPEDGWDDRGVSVVVPAAGRRAVGYASPAPPADPPLELVESVPADDATDPGGTTDAATDALDSADAVVRDLGDPSPPRDAVPLPAADGADEGADGRDEPIGSGGPDESGGSVAGAAPGEPRTPGEALAPDEALTPDAAPAADAAPPEPVAAWLDDVEARIDRAESLAAADSLPAATRALRSVGGLDGANRVSAVTERDAAALRAVAERAERLADRAAGAEVPVETLERIA
ncbi:hypothetical protein [Halomicrobium salinisoli]|uniref:DUF7857 domain-containing protein n=1 Tax=Halomicrobium salinisoli TaxID=2878391 RepID=UPI001CEFE782|nr:hypothetical protein [Halomicrobium salinisoli]